jgi:hypothetical protein
MSVTEPHPDNVPGPFYVENQCCISCGVPTDIAPDIFAWTPDESHCFVALQPQTEAETDRTLRALFSAEVECIRYRGCDTDIRRRIAEFGSGECCDEPLAHVRPVVRNRVTFCSARAGDDPLALAERLRTYLAQEDAALAAKMRASFLDEKFVVEERIRAELVEKYKDWTRYTVRTPRLWNRHVAIFAWDAVIGRPHYNRVAFHTLAGERFEARLSSGFSGAGWGLALIVHDWLTESEKADRIEWRTSRGADPHPFRAPI